MSLLVKKNQNELSRKEMMQVKGGLENGPYVGVKWVKGHGVCACACWCGPNDGSSSLAVEGSNVKTNNVT